MALELRDYQQQGIDGIRDAFRRRRRRVVYVLCTGGGKSILSTYMAKSAAERGSRTLFHAHSEELVSNLKKALSGWGLPFGVIEPGHRETNHLIQVGRTKTIANRIRKNLAIIERISDPEKRVRLSERYKYDMLVTDECHHVAAGNTWWYVLEHNADAFHLGVTATPARLDGKPLGREYGGWWEDMVVGPSVMDLIEHPEGPFLCPPVVYQADKSKLPDFSQLRKRGGDYRAGDLSALMAGSGRYVYGDAVGEYRKRCDGAPGIAFCVDVQAAEQCAEQFRAGGYQSTVLVADTPNRASILRDLEQGRLHMVASVMALTEGVDVPLATCGIMLRKTASLVLARQMAGRILRPHPAKDRAILLDMVGNTFDDAHGLPTDDIEWSLDHKPKKKQQREAGEAAGRQCQNCFAWNPPRAKVCLECKESFKQAETAQIDMIEGDLQEVDAVAISRRRREHKQRIYAQMESVITSEDTPISELVRIGKLLEHKHPDVWARNQHRRNQNKWQGKNYGT